MQCSTFVQVTRHIYTEKSDNILSRENIQEYGLRRQSGCSECAALWAIFVNLHQVRIIKRHQMLWVTNTYPHSTLVNANLFPVARLQEQINPEEAFRLIELLGHPTNPYASNLYSRPSTVNHQGLDAGCMNNCWMRGCVDKIHNLHSYTCSTRYCGYYGKSKLNQSSLCAA